MGTLEKAVQSEVRRTLINRAIIGVLATAGVLAVGVVAPQVIGAMGKLGLINPYQKRQGVKKALTRLIESGYIKIVNNKASLTSKGEKLAALLGEGRLAPKKPRHWDKKWRLLIFDIPERRKNVRSKIRITLIQLGFCRLQDSVWVYPYDCEDIILILKIDLNVGKEVLYVIADKIEHDAPLRKHFNL